MDIKYHTSVIKRGLIPTRESEKATEKRWHKN